MGRTFLLRLAFDGGAFAGWQRQPGERTVQQVVEEALSRLAAGPVRVHAAGRTDAGVHALALAASTELPARWTAAALRRALNAVLPDDVWVADAHAMASGFHARRCAESRRYRYQVGTDDAARSPFRRRWEWALGRPLDVALLDAAAATVVGTHDFTAFSVRGQEKAHHRCRLVESRWTRADDAGRLTYWVEADRFLHHMVRMLVGTMVDIGLGRRPLEDMRRLLASADNRDTSPPAPPEGLWFVEARYAPQWYLAGDAEPAP